MKQLTLTVHIDPATAVREGKSQVGETTVTLTDSDLAQLTEEQRETLALHVANAPFPEPWKFRGDNYSTPRYGKQLTDYAHPVADTSIETIATLLDTRKAVVAAQLEKFRQADLETQQKADAKLLTAIANPPVRKHWLNKDGDIVSYGGILTVELPSLSGESFSDCSAEVQAQLESAKKRVAQEAERIRLEAIPQIKAIVEKRAAEKAVQKAAYQKEYERLPALLRERHAAGFASDVQVQKALRNLFLSDAGYSSGVFKNRDSEEINTLTDQEYLKFREVQNKAPKGAECTPKTLYEQSKYRPATDCDDPEEIDSDGEVRVPDEVRNPRRVVIISWDRVGITVKTAVPLS